MEEIDNLNKNRKLHKVLKSIVKYTFSIIVILASFLYGRFYESYNKEVVEVVVATKVKKEDVNIALDEKRNLIIIDNKSGRYTVYQDSIGHQIFNIYAKNIWAQHKK